MKTGYNYTAFWVVLDSRPQQTPVPEGRTTCELIARGLLNTRGVGHTDLVVDAFTERARYATSERRRNEERVPLMVFSSYIEAERALRGSSRGFAHYFRAVTTPHELERELLRRGPTPLLIDNHVIAMMGEEFRATRASQPRPVAVFMVECDARRWVSLHKEHQQKTMSVVEVMLDPSLIDDYEGDRIRWVDPA